MLTILFEDLIRKTAVVMQEVARFLDLDPAGCRESTFDRVHNPFEAFRRTFARSVLRRRPTRVWSNRWVPQKLRTAVRNRLLFTNRQEPRLDEEARQSFAERLASDS